jgi:hypothetical protein
MLADVLDDLQKPQTLQRTYLNPAMPTHGPLLLPYTVLQYTIAQQLLSRTQIDPGVQSQQANIG